MGAMKAGMNVVLDEGYSVAPDRSSPVTKLKTKLKRMVYGTLLVVFIIFLPQGLLDSAQARWAVARRG
jgi:ABC-type branched-subunit amino acid transport system permease subunit